MGYTNSSMVAYTKLSPNHSGQRTHSIDRISPHCVVGQCTAEGLGDWFYKSSTQASSNYGIDKDGRVGLYVEEKNRSWCTSSNANDQRAITIECASDTTEPYTMNSKVYDTLIKLCTDICKRNGKKKLLWFADKDKSLNYAPKSDEMVITVHRWFANKSCPGNWLYARLGDVAAKVTANLADTGTAPVATTKTQATVFSKLSEAEVVAKAGALFTADQKKCGILASVSMAQFILESGYGKSELAQNANNCFGMKTSLSGNTWSGSTWDGKSKYTKKTQEEYTKGEMTTITADFRKYPCIEDSISDHSAYLLGAKNGSKLRYDGLKGCTDYKKAAQIIKDGGYATSSTYVSNLCSIIEKWKLTQFDVGASTPAPDNTVKKFPATPFMVRVIIDNLNYRSEPSMNGRVNGQTGVGTFTIMEVKNGWGRLKSGAGWIYLENTEYCTVGNTVTAAAKSATKTVDELAKEVIKGLWGNGTERKNKLTAAGYDYTKVQNRVNELLK
ncbi:TPA: glucosaminidase domain-containing protein [Streptococcus equi subsp. zooepidemicus]|nr:glucosaminidase domain-containing protein [Streptococcus equi subsp. zooepidemicus]HEL1185251.1 glucosaminidase domain-containing protein [Streptococcus equi subsp. zooepidemicus]